MIDAVALATEGLWATIVLTVPVALVAVAASATVSALASYVGLTDPTLARVARMLAVLLAVGLMLEAFGDRFVELARDGIGAVAFVETP